jgi:hypothetical protein
MGCNEGTLKQFVRENMLRSFLDLSFLRFGRKFALDSMNLRFRLQYIAGNGRRFLCPILDDLVSGASYDQ